MCIQLAPPIYFFRLHPLFPSSLHVRSFSSVATVLSLAMVEIDIILLFAGALCLVTANPVKLDQRQSGASTTSPPWYPSRTFFFFLSELITIGNY